MNLVAFSADKGYIIRNFARLENFVFCFQEKISLNLEEELKKLRKNHKTAAKSAQKKFFSNWPYSSSEAEAFLDEKLENEYEKRV